MDTLTCCDCGCEDCSSHKHDEFSNNEPRDARDLSLSLSLSISSNAKVQIENECHLLRETVASQRESIQDLYSELDEERNAASTAANEAMSMILRLQREKAEVEMELRQFKRFSEEKMEHDRQELLALEDLVYKREQTIQALTFEAQAYRHRMMSYGFSEDAEVDDDDVEKNVYDYYDYPPLKCSLNEVVVDDVEKYTLTDSPRGGDNLRISQSPKRHRHFRKVSTDFSVDSPRSNGEMHDRVYTIDSVHQGGEEKVMDDGEMNQPGVGDPDIVKLYARMQALEADRESMRQAIVSMRTEKAQMVLLKEIAQHLSKEVVLERRQASIGGVFSFLSVFKWITSFVFWRKKARRSKYMNVVQANNMGLEMLLEKTPRTRQWRCLSSTQV
ncbi:BnaC02g01950D [Brassica napus]|uniref:GTD-binding domain-containing protein n=2 Tax=Brassica TaxID=3705 RepID=A0A0D3AHZ3_BRAOL|nr:PREDICTED: myosin-binding protein 7-like [Brassica oleracea var. oleracea]CAF1880224.1 unnamed protein product [Brassica napus]CDY14078.1 BnaC02g01950D [Brassica napus]